MISNFLEEFSPDTYPVIWTILSLILGIIFCKSSIPSILYVSHDKNLVAAPESRSSHRIATPTLGGIAIFLSIVLVMTFIGAFVDSKLILLVMGAISILFFFGLKDDLASISVRTKLLGQLSAIALVIFFTDTRLLSLSGLFGVYEIPYIASVLLTVFFFLMVINAFNLIDGIDGLAGGLGLSSCFVLGIFLYLEKQMSLVFIAAGLCGALIVFLRYNFSVKHKLFMGDNGSLVIGYIIAFLGISFVNHHQTLESMPYHNSAAVIALAILFYPIADTIRIFFLRIFKYKRNPFSPDRNHIHHQYTKFYSHKRASLYIVVLNLFTITLAYLCKDFEINLQLISLVVYGSILFSLTFAIRRFRAFQKRIKSGMKRSTVEKDQKI